MSRVFLNVDSSVLTEQVAAELCNRFYGKDLWNNPGVLPDELDRELWRDMAGRAVCATIDAILPSDGT